MASAPYMEQYLDSLENLPVELQRNFNLMRDLDSRAQEQMRNIDKMADDFMSNINIYSADKKNETMNSIQRQFNKAKEYGDDKVQLSIQTYELVDKHIRKLDSDLARFEAEIQDRAISSTRNVEEGLQKRGQRKFKDKKKNASSEEETVLNKTSKKKSSRKGIFCMGTTNKSSTAPSKTPMVSVVPNLINPANSVAGVLVETGPVTGTLVAAGVVHSPEVLDMPVDPNEPTYCLCNQVSYGEMIGCDNPDCPIEWFHFACVKLITKPKGKWFCSKCMTNKKKK
uniref:Inhibitor of growth protein n=1 Tax=Melanaphis sacchari TaxID=742174 RepID=A0A2H8TVC7_9HEMI